MRLQVAPLFAAALALAACDKSADSSNPPKDATAAADGGEQAEGEGEKAEGEGEKAEGEGEKAEGEGEKAEGEKAEEPPKDYFTAATFNLGWAHDSYGDGSKTEAENRAKKAEDWDWKSAEIGKVIAKTQPDIIALHELGGSGEASDIVAAILEADGPEYKWAYQESDDPRNNHNIAILSRFPITEERRFDVHLRRHVVADVELPTGDKITVVAIHPPEGTRKRAAKARVNQVESVVREINQLREDRPVIVLATMGSEISPADEKYDKSAAGMLAGANTNSEDDDCDDSSKVGLVAETTTNGVLADRIFSCDLEMRDAETAGSVMIIREAVDPGDKPWSAVPVDKEPHRDVSDHLILVAEIALPKKDEKKAEGEGKAEDKEDKAEK